MAKIRPICVALVLSLLALTFLVPLPAMADDYGELDFESIAVGTFAGTEFQDWGVVFSVDSQGTVEAEPVDTNSGLQGLGLGPGGLNIFTENQGTINNGAVRATFSYPKSMVSIMVGTSSSLSAAIITMNA